MLDLKMSAQKQKGIVWTLMFVIIFRVHITGLACVTWASVNI